MINASQNKLKKLLLQYKGIPPYNYNNPNVYCRSLLTKIRAKYTRAQICDIENQIHLEQRMLFIKKTFGKSVYQ